MGRTRAAKVCPQPGCPQDQPCPAHTQAPWADSDTRRPTALRGRALQERNARILRRDGHRCQATSHTTGCDGTATEVDHLTEVADGGTEDDHYLHALNSHCHRAKTQAHAAAARA